MLRESNLGGRIGSGMSRYAEAKKTGVLRSMEARLISPALLAALLSVSMGALPAPILLSKPPIRRWPPRSAQTAEKFRARFGHRLARAGDAQLGSAVHDDRAGMLAHSRRRSHDVRLRQRRGVWLADDDPGQRRARARFRASPRDHAHGLRQLLPPAAAPLGGRRRRTSVEHISEKQKHRQMLVQFLAPAAASPSARCSP